MAIVVYLLLCAFVGHLGRYRRIKFLGNFLFSIVLTPLVIFLVLLLTSDDRATNRA